MNLLRNMKIRSKLAVMLFFPVIGILYFSITGIHEKYELSKSMSSLRALSEVAVSLSAVIHETQKERGMSAGYISSKGAKFASELPAQRTKNDSRISELKMLLSSSDIKQHGSEFKSDLSRSLQFIEMVDRKRKEVDALSISTAEEIKFYSGMINSMLSIIAGMSALSVDVEMSSLMSAYYNFLEEKERAGIERAVLSASFAAKKFEEGMYRKFISLVSGQDIYEKVFLSFATQEQQTFYNEKMQNKYVRDVNKMRDVAYQKADVGNFDVDANEWFATITGKINILKEIEDRLSDDLNLKADQLKREARKAFTFFIVVSSISIAVTFVLVILIYRDISRPVNSVVAMLEDIARGEGDLTKRIDISSKDEIGQLAVWFNTFMDKLHDIIYQVTLNIEQLATAATEISASSVQLSAGMTEQTNQAAQVSTAVEEMTATIIETSKNTADAAEKASQAAGKSQEGGQLAENTSRGMDKIVNSSIETAQNIQNLAEKAIAIGEIIEVIDDIADQTNLLALNAAIEAARAGEQGRGFAVVADEVRRLADRTTAATKEVADTIKEIQSDVSNANNQIADSKNTVDEGKDLVEKTNSSLNEIFSTIESVQDMMRQIASAANEQSAAAEDISKNVENVNRISQESATGSEEAASAAEQLNRQSEELKALVGGFKLSRITESVT
ncbi:MAG: methyl-accepting chemotaxis protein [candidate division Zixibacteria bacterium]|nr:methyl-accepting chemotaxis protein [candidate division Zixibacteria bacterium]